MKHANKRSIFSRTSLLAAYSARMGDAVQRHRASLTLDAARIEAELASKAKSEFIAKMSHELRTPLNAIIGFSEVLGDKRAQSQSPEKVFEYSRYIHDSAHHLLSIVNNILELSKIQSGKVTLNTEPMDLEEVLESCLVLFHDSAQENTIELRRQIWPDLPLVEGDITKVRQIIINLVSNAIKFTPAGGRVTITIDTVGLDTARLVVRDTGIGMSADDLEIAMQPFGQADSGMARRFEGSGLGVPIVHLLTDLHKGAFHIHSEVNKGTTATVTLPISATQNSAPQQSTFEGEPAPATPVLADGH